jgi:hypothetical protein
MGLPTQNREEPKKDTGDTCCRENRSETLDKGYIREKMFVNIQIYRFKAKYCS